MTKSSPTLTHKLGIRYKFIFPSRITIKNLLLTNYGGKLQPELKKTHIKDLSFITLGVPVNQNSAKIMLTKTVI